MKREGKRPWKNFVFPDKISFSGSKVKPGVGERMLNQCRKKTIMRKLEPAMDLARKESYSEILCIQCKFH